MSPQDARATLLSRTVQVIADEGLDKTTTKAIVAGTGINEAYIYRYFSDKEDLLAKAFDMLDCSMVATVLQHLPVMSRTELDYETRCRALFFPIWRFMLAAPNECLAYMRYYYSPYFLKSSFDAHKQRYTPVIDKMRPAFKEDADVWMILNHILSIMLSFAVRVHNGHMSAEDDYSEHVFRVIYASVKQYFKTSKESEA